MISSQLLDITLAPLSTCNRNFRPMANHASQGEACWILMSA